MSFLYVTLVTEGALIIFFPDKKRQGALIGAGALNGANTVVSLQAQTSPYFQLMREKFKCIEQNRRKWNPALNFSLKPENLNKTSPNFR